MDFTPDSESRVSSPDPSPEYTSAPSPEVATAAPVDLSPLLDELSELRAVVGDVSSTVLSRFGAYYNDTYTGGLSVPHYLIWRDSQYVYYMAVLTGSTYSGGSIQGEFDLITYQSSSSYGSMPSMSVQTLSDRSISIPLPGEEGSAYVYSNLPGYLPSSYVDAKPALSVSLSLAMLIALAGTLIFLWIRGLFHAKD